MIRFFRKIRQEFLAERRFSKYLLYAIGEIILVVIGILIALQINNWNEGRKNHALVENYKVGLLEDLTKDSIDIRMAIAYIRDDSATLKGFEDRITTATEALDTMYHIARYEYNFLIYGKWDYNSDTYNVLTSTGDIALFDNEIIGDLNALYNQKEMAVNSANHTFDSYRSNLHRYAQKYPVPFQSNLITNGSPAADLIWDQISKVEHATEFNALVLAKGDAYRLSLGHLPKVAEATHALLAKLRKE